MTSSRLVPRDAGVRDRPTLVNARRETVSRTYCSCTSLTTYRLQHSHNHRRAAGADNARIGGRRSRCALLFHGAHDVDSTGSASNVGQRKRAQWSYSHRHISHNALRCCTCTVLYIISNNAHYIKFAALSLKNNILYHFSRTAKFRGTDNESEMNLREKLMLESRKICGMSLATFAVKIELGECCAERIFPSHITFFFFSIYYVPGVAGIDCHSEVRLAKEHINKFRWKYGESL